MKSKLKTLISAIFGMSAAFGIVYMLTGSLAFSIAIVLLELLIHYWFRGPFSTNQEFRRLRHLSEKDKLRF